MTPQEHKQFLRELDERILPRIKGETDQAYGKRMREYFNGLTPSPVTPADQTHTENKG